MVAKTVFCLAALRAENSVELWVLRSVVYSVALSADEMVGYWVGRWGCHSAANWVVLMEKTTADQ
jgi:hypothetical protein